ncbi:MAG: HAMP domain-containing protein, partial [Pseudomonadota bacterium]
MVRASSIRAHAGWRIDSVYAEIGPVFERALRQSAGVLHVSDLDGATPQARAALRAGTADARALSLQMLLRVDDARGEPSGVLVASLHADPMLQALQDARRRAPGALPAALLNARGDLLLSTDQSRLLEPHPLAPALALQGAFRSVEPAQQTYYRVSDAQGRALIASVGVMPGIVAPMGETGDLAWRVLVSASEQVINAETRSALTMVRVLILMVLFTVVLLGIVVSRHFGRSIETLAEGARRIAAGDLAHRITPQTNDELGALCLSFNIMSEKIASSLSEKDAVVKEQTALAASLDASKTELERTLARTERQNSEITLRNEIGELLQSCTSVEEAGVVTARFLPLLFPGASGAVYMATPGGETLVAVARWGAAPVAETVAPIDCWALRRGKTHLVTG